MPCAFVGYPFSKKGYKLYSLDTKSCFMSRDVIFHKHIFYFLKSSDASSTIFPFFFLLALIISVLLLHLILLILSLRMLLLSFLVFLLLLNLLFLLLLIFLIPLQRLCLTLLLLHLFWEGQPGLIIFLVTFKAMFVTLLLIFQVPFLILIFLNFS